VTLRARDASREMDHSLKLVSLELARQVKRHRDKRRHRREARTGAVRATLPQVDSPEIGEQPAG
jgi:putative sigma-54 modulation protein